MEAKIAILTPFFQRPQETFHIREVAKLTGINHTTVRKYLQAMVKEGILIIKEDKLYDMYRAADSLAFRNIQLYYTLEILRKSTFLAEIEKNDPEAIVMLSSFAESLELCIIYQESCKSDKYSPKELESTFGKKVIVQYYDAKKMQSYLKNDAMLFQRIMNGIVIKGSITITHFV